MGLVALLLLICWLVLGTTTGAGAADDDAASVQPHCPSQWSRPVYFWAQNNTHLFLSVKFSTKFTAPSNANVKIQSFVVDTDQDALRRQEWQFAKKMFKGGRSSLNLHAASEDDDDATTPCYNLQLDLWGPVRSASWKKGSAGRVTVTLEKAPLDWTPKMNIDDDDDEDVESFEHNDDEDVHSYSGRWPGPIVKGSQRGKLWESMQGQLEREHAAVEEAAKKALEEKEKEEKAKAEKALKEEEGGEEGGEAGSKEVGGDGGEDVEKAEGDKAEGDIEEAKLKKKKGKKKRKK